MEQAKKQKTIRIVGFIALTILVIVGVVLTVYFVQKGETNTKKGYINTQICQTVSLDKIDFTVTNIAFEPSYAEDVISVNLTINIDAKENYRDSLYNYGLSNGCEPFGEEGHKEALKAGESSTFKVNFVVKDNQELLYLIYAGKIKVALGEAHI